ncbi:ABC transporter permease [Arthrobacter sp. JSM 101049]|uniref:ABC transporter permease n=1 Tax=Arthrobacter sp. JSM 101049 TaxID=929097 RepID=UPI003569FAF7
MSATMVQRKLGLGFLAGVGTVFRMETRQRLRTRGWYILLVVWFVVIGLVAALAAYATGAWSPDDGAGYVAGSGIGEVMFELVIAFVLFFGLLVAPALSANTVSGDRSAGTLAVLQNTLLTPGQILAGKWLAAWVSSLAFLVVSLPMVVWAMTYGDVYLPGVPVFLLMTAVEFGVVCAIGVGVSARAGRTLFAVVSTYLLIALLALGTAIAYGLSFQLVEEEVTVSAQVWPDDPWSKVHYNDAGEAVDAQGKVIKDQDAYFTKIQEQADSYTIDPNAYVCGPDTYETSIFHTERITWLLAANPFVVIADAVPTRASGGPSMGSGIMNSLSQGVRGSQAGLPGQAPCLEGKKQFAAAVADAELDGAPLWPLGLLVQLCLAALLLLLGRERLVTPVRRLSRGTRIA